MAKEKDGREELGKYVPQLQILDPPLVAVAAACDV